MSFEPNHYEVLGLPSTATAAQIKRKYRELARLYHPDVNGSPEAAQRILSVNQAYRILGDPDRRAVYDAERSLGRPAQNGSSSAKPASTQNRRPANTQSNGRGRPYYDGFGRAYPQPKPERRPPASAGAASQRRMPDAQETSIERVITEAKLAFINRDYQRGLRLCQQVLQINPREGVALEIMGDIYARQGNIQRASTYFAYAIQFNPRNQTAQAKLERLMGAVDSRQSGPSITYTRQAFRHAASHPTSSTGMAAVALAAGGLLIAAPCALYMNPGNPSRDPLAQLLGITFNLIAALAVGGVASGLLLAFFGRMRPFKDEVWSGRQEDGFHTPAPLAVILGLFAAIWFYGSFLVYIGISATRNRFSPSVLRTYATAFALVFVFGLVYWPVASNSGWMAILLGGNVVFPAVLFGWLLGDAFRLRGRI